MLKLIIGGASSGKSDYAEQLIRKDYSERRISSFQENSELIYLATMTAKDPESLRRIDRHRERRKDSGFQTVEAGKDFLNSISNIPKNSFVLLEDIPNLVANWIFGDMPNEFSTLDSFKNGEIVHSIVDGILKLHSACKEVVAVTGDLFSDGFRYEEETEAYLRALGEVNCELAAASDFVCEVVCGKINILKGNLVL